jgi:hypothetical protein
LLNPIKMWGWCNGNALMYTRGGGALGKDICYPDWAFRGFLSDLTAHGMFCIDYLDFRLLNVAVSNKMRWEVGHVW